VSAGIKNEEKKEESAGECLGLWGGPHPPRPNGAASYADAESGKPDDGFVDAGTIRALIDSVGKEPRP